jgi:hypothetical protein
MGREGCSRRDSATSESESCREPTKRRRKGFLAHFWMVSRPFGVDALYGHMWSNCNNNWKMSRNLHR